MIDETNSAHIAEGESSASPNVDQVADQIIADCGGDARAAVVELVGLVRHLANQNTALIEASSPGFVRRPPPCSKKSR